MKRLHFLVKRVPILKALTYSCFRFFRFSFWRFRKGYYSIDLPPQNLLVHLETVLKTLPVGQSKLSVTEVGCNSGALLFSLAKKFPSISFLGLDLQASAINQGTTRVKELGIRNLEFLATDVRNYPFSKPVDVLVTSATLIYLKSDELMRFFEKAIKSVGKVIVLNEIMSRTPTVYRSHFFAHPYKEILKDPIFDGFSVDIHSARHPPWDTDEHEGAIITLTRKG